MRKCLFSALIFFALAVPGEAQIRDPRCGAIPTATADTAKAFADAISTAIAKIEADFGGAVFNTLDGIPTSEGSKTLGEVWGGYLNDTGFPKDAPTRQCAALDFVALGMAPELADVIVLGIADKSALEKLVQGLRAISQ